jgi:ribosome recycling factor
MTAIASSKDAMVQARSRMEKAVDDFRKELSTVRTGRANVSVLDHVRVDYHGTPMPINQLGTMSVPDASTIVISPWDAAAVPMIDTAIRTSDLGLNAQPYRRPPKRNGEAHSQGRRESQDRAAKRAPRYQRSRRKARER